MKTKLWMVAGTLSLALATGCNGQVGDAVSSIASGSPPTLPSITLPSRSAGITTPTGGSPTEASPTEASPTEASPTETSPTETSPTETSPTAVPTPGVTESPASGGTASTGTSAGVWWVLGILAVGIIVALLIMRRRRPTSLQDAYLASAAVRDRLAQEVSVPSLVPGELETMIEEADRRLRAAQVTGLDQAARTSVDRTLVALDRAREAIALRSASADAAHASGSDIEAALLRALSALDAALGPLRSAVGGRSASGFEG